MSDKYNETEASVRGILATLWDIARGAADSVRLSLAERLTLLLSAIALALVAVILVTAILAFVSVGVARVLESVSPHGAYFMVAGFYAVLLIVVVALRRRLITDPVCRLVTRLIVAPPEEDSKPVTTKNEEEDGNS